MSTWNLVRTIGGAFVLISVALGAPASPFFHSSYWLWFTVFVGANLMQSGLSHWCLLERILRKLGVREGDSCGITSSKA